VANYIKIPIDFFENPIIENLGTKNYGDSVILLYLHLLCATGRTKGVFRIGNIALTDDVLDAVFRHDNTHYALCLLEQNGLVKRNECTIQVFKFWDDLHDRNSQRYKDWRISVFVRDGFRCQSCGTKKEIQAHHIKAWKSNKKLRYEVSNGITLCRKCHLEAHGGCWRNG
jgi:5-methylcytosine-specific restriction endonuclease McrA